MTDGWTFRTRIETHMLTGAVTLWQVWMGSCAGPMPQQQGWGGGLLNWVTGTTVAPGGVERRLLSLVLQAMVV